MTGYRSYGPTGGTRKRPYYYNPTDSPPGEAAAQNAAIRRRLIVTASLILLASALIGAVLVSFFTSYFDIKYIEVEGLSGHTAEEIMSYLGAETGDKIYSLRTADAREAILAVYPEILDVKISRKLPDGVVISLSYDSPVYFTEVTGEYYALSESLRVISRHVNGDELRDEGLKFLSVPNIKRAVTGEKMEFFREDEQYILPVLEEISRSSFWQEADSILIGGKFDISVMKSGSYEVKLGDIGDVSLKLKMADKMLDAGEYRSDSGVTVDISNVYEGSVSVDNSLKMK